MRERLADFAHELWSGWMKYLFLKCRKDTFGRVFIPAILVERWNRQMNTPYADLPEAEKESDREQADKLLEIIK